MSDRTLREQTLDTAKQLTLSDRNKDYGEPIDDFTNVVGALNSFGYRGPGGRLLTPHDLPFIQVVVKLSRLVTTPDKADSWVDIAGYAACGREVSEQQKAKFAVGGHITNSSDAGNDSIPASISSDCLPISISEDADSTKTPRYSYKFYPALTKESFGHLTFWWPKNSASPQEVLDTAVNIASRMGLVIINPYQTSVITPTGYRHTWVVAETGEVNA